MPTYRITLEDGSVYKVTVDDAPQPQQSLASKAGHFVLDTAKKLQDNLSVAPVLETLGRADTLLGAGQQSEHTDDPRYSMFNPILDRIPVPRAQSIADAWHELRNLVPGASPTQQVLGNQQGNTFSDQKQYVDDTYDKFRNHDISGGLANVGAFATGNPELMSRTGGAAWESVSPTVNAATNKVRQTATNVKQGIAAAKPYVRAAGSAGLAGVTTYKKPTMYGPALAAGFFGNMIGGPHLGEALATIGAAPEVVSSMRDAWNNSLAGVDAAPATQQAKTKVPKEKPYVVTPSNTQVNEYGTPYQSPDIPVGLDPPTPQAPNTQPLWSSRQTPKPPYFSLTTDDIIPDLPEWMHPSTSGLRRVDNTDPNAIPLEMQQGIIYNPGEPGVGQPLVQPGWSYSNKKTVVPSGAPMPSEYLHAPDSLTIQAGQASDPGLTGTTQPGALQSQPEAFQPSPAPPPGGYQLPGNGTPIQQPVVPGPGGTPAISAGERMFGRNMTTSAQADKARLLGRFLRETEVPLDMDAIRAKITIANKFKAANGLVKAKTPERVIEAALATGDPVIIDAVRTQQKLADDALAHGKTRGYVPADKESFVGVSNNTLEQALHPDMDEHLSDVLAGKVSGVSPTAGGVGGPSGARLAANGANTGTAPSLGIPIQLNGIHSPIE